MNFERQDMRIEQLCWTESGGWRGTLPVALAESAQLVLTFGSPRALEATGGLDRLRGWYPRAILMGCSTAGEICGTRVLDDSLTATAVHFEDTRLRLAHTKVGNGRDSREAGAALARELEHQGLAYVLLLSDGLRVNGSDLAGGLRAELPAGVIVTGGLAGDGDRFHRTLLCADAPPAEGLVAALGFYGRRLRVGCGSLGGWDPFGPERLITRSRGNVLFELDGLSALALYRAYLGEHAAGLPATALLFPLELRTDDPARRVVRTVLSIDEAAQSMRFAGDMPEGTYARLMKANFDRLVGGAIGAARASTGLLGGGEAAELALLISCVGRKLILKQRTEEEVEGVREVVGPQAVLTGFYSYGEICPAAPRGGCELHNQTMTITAFSER
jgi:hypothetical protein